MIFTHDIVLDITFHEIKTINIKQYTENSHILHVTVTDRGIPFTIDKNNSSCYFKMLTPSNNHIFVDGIIEDDGTISIYIPEKACLTAGNGTAELRIISSEPNSTAITMDLNIHIISSVYEDSEITSTDDFSALNHALERVEKKYANAEANAVKSESYAHGETDTRENEDTDNAKYYYEQAKGYAESASNSETAVSNAKTLVDKAKQEISDSQAAIESLKKQASEYALTSQSYAIGDTKTRENEAVDNAKYYYEQVRGISEGLQGALLPMGTIPFSQLSSQAKTAGYMYNISDEFTTDSTFKEGAGYIYPAGTNVYYTADGYWDCLAGTMVTGIKGAAEGSYRKGNVNITPDNIGAMPVTKISETTDFNTLTDTGIYIINIARCTNAPNGSAGILIVSGSQADQIFLPYFTNCSFHRFFYHLTKWTDWKMGSAEQDGNGNVITDTYLPKNDLLDLVYPVGSIYMSTNSANPGALFGGTWVSWGNGRVPVGVDTSDSIYNTSEKSGGSKTTSYTPSGTVGSHTLTVNEIPSHGHNVSVTSSGTCTIQSSGEHTHDVYKNATGGGGTVMRLGSSANHDGTVKAVPSGGAHTHTVPNHTHTLSQSNAGGGSGHSHGFTGSTANISTVQPYITCYMWKRTA